MTKLPVISPYIMGNPPKISKWRLMETSEAQGPDWREDLLVFIIVGKRGKMRRKEQPLLSTRGCRQLPVTWVKSDIR